MRARTGGIRSGCRLCSFLEEDLKPEQMETDSLWSAALHPSLFVRLDEFTASERSSAAPGLLNYHTNLNPAEAHRRSSSYYFSHAGPNYWPMMINLLSVSNVALR